MFEERALCSFGRRRGRANETAPEHTRLTMRAIIEYAGLAR